jgi:hypothetical protein
VFVYPPYAEPGDPTPDIYHPLRNTPASVWWIFDQQTLRLPADYDITTLEEYAAAFPGQPVFLVAGDGELPDHLPADRFRLADVVVAQLSIWDEAPAGGPRSYRPDEPWAYGRGLTIWQLDGP